MTLLPLDANVGEGGRHSQARMVGEEIFSAAQRPENLQNPSQPSQRPRSLIDRSTRCQPVSDAGVRLAEKGKGRLGAVQSVGQRRTVEESGKRLGSLSVGVASSQEQCSTKRRRKA